MFLPSISSCRQPWYHTIKMIFKLSCILYQNTLFSITSLHHESGVFYNFLQNLIYPQASYQKCFKKENGEVKCSKGLLQFQRGFCFCKYFLFCILANHIPNHNQISHFRVKQHSNQTTEVIKEGYLDQFSHAIFLFPLNMTISLKSFNCTMTCNRIESQPIHLLISIKQVSHNK